MTVFEVMWKLPVAVAMQIYYCRLGHDGVVLVTGENDWQLLKRLKACRI